MHQFWLARGTPAFTCAHKHTSRELHLQGPQVPSPPRVLLKDALLGPTASEASVEAEGPQPFLQLLGHRERAQWLLGQVQTQVS